MKPRLTIALVSLLVACGGEAATYEWDLPPGFPEPAVPADNPMSEVKVELGRRLFYDTRLSGNETFSCASCHEQRIAFTDGRATSLGSTGEIHPRAAMPLMNVAYAASLNWANPITDTLEAQALGPMFGDQPVELGLAGRDEEMLARLRAEPIYQDLFPAAFPADADPFSVDNITKALSAFERTMISGNSAYDRYIAGDPSAMSEAAIRGMDLFFGEELECFHCHGGFNFSQSVEHTGTVFDQAFFQNNGLYDLDGRGLYPTGNAGVFDVTGDPDDMGLFKPPSLRNIGVTAPYMHDGSLATLEDVVRMYAAGGNVIEDGPNAGDGRNNPNKSVLLVGFVLDEQRLADVVAFLNALTDEEFLTDPRFSDPWTE